MNTAETIALAEEHMSHYGLLAKGWKFKLDGSTKRFGICRNRIKTISMSRRLSELNDRPTVEDTILHEIAHALTPGAGHNSVWQAKAIELGASPAKYYDAKEVKPWAPWYLRCPRCGESWARTKKTNRQFYCRACSIALTGKRWSPDSKLNWVKGEHNHLVSTDGNARPQSGVTLRVWELCEQLVQTLAKQGDTTDPTKQLAVDYCASYGINRSTAAIQYGRWFKNRKGVSK